MKNKILLFITIILICIFPTYIFAEEENIDKTVNTYNNLNITSIITTSVNMDEIDKFKVKYRVYTSEDKYKEEEVTLIKSDNYSSKKYYQGMINASFVTAYAVARDGTIDKYGFVTFKPNTIYDVENSMITLELQVSFNDMGFDGRNYRKNSDISDDYIEERKNGVALKDSEVITKSGTQPTTIPVTTTERRVITDNSYNNNSKNNEQHNEQSYKILEYIIIGAFIIIGVVSAVVLVKYNASNKRV